MWTPCWSMSCSTPFTSLLHLEEEIQVKVGQLDSSSLALQPEKHTVIDIKGEGNVLCKPTHATLLPK